MYQNNADKSLLFFLLILCLFVSIFSSTLDYSEEAFNLTASCNADCQCDNTFDPVCGSNNIMYYSSCHAGCTFENTTEDGGTVRYFNDELSTYHHLSTLHLITVPSSSSSLFTSFGCGAGNYNFPTNNIYDLQLKRQLHLDSNIFCIPQTLLHVR